MFIGICDDNKSDIIRIQQFCEEYMYDKGITCQYKLFMDGEEVIAYCQNSENPTINLLFLDIEMPGIHGIELKDKIVKNNLIYRIAFVTSHEERIRSTYSKKTIGFIDKPASQEEISKMINIMMEDLKDNIVIDYMGYHGERINIPIDNILYFEANESYTKIVTYEQNEKENRCNLISKKLGQIEEEMAESGFIRVHKSYLVNAANVTDIGDKICFKDYEFSIPVGRKYKEKARNYYLLFGKKQMRKRL